MSSGFSYAKWDHIEISDDEDDTHPNVDTPSLFKWRHEARLQRMEEEKREKAKRLMEKEKIQKEKEEAAKLLEEKAKAAADAGDASQVEGLKSKLTELEMQEKAFLEKEAEIERMEKEHPKWHVDNISKDKVSRTIINKGSSTQNEKPAGVDMELSDYFNTYGKEVKHFGMLEKHEAAHEYLREHLYLVCEHLASYLVIWCVDLEVEEKHSLMKRVAKQTVVAQFLIELAKSVNRDPRQCLDIFYSKIKSPEPQYKSAFDDELNGLIARVKDRAKARFEEAKIRAAKEEEKAKLERMKNGLDPLEVLESLPQKIREAFENQDTPKLQEGFAELAPEDAQYHYERVVKSGLWVPAGAETSTDPDGGEEADEEDSSEEEEGKAAGEDK